MCYKFQNDTEGLLNKVIEVHVHESFFLFAQHLHPLAGVRGISRLNSNGEKYSKIKNKVIEEKQFYVNQYLTSGIDH